MAAVRLSGDDLQDRLEALEAANARLQDELDMLRTERFGCDLGLPVEWMLACSEAAIFRTLMANESCRKEALLMALPLKDHANPPEIKIVDVYICKIRRKVEPFGILIETRWGQGYFISPAMKVHARALIAGSASLELAA